MPGDLTGQFYPAAEGSIGYGAQVLMGDGASPETFEAIAGVRSITFGETSVADVRRTHLRSLDAHHEHAPGMLDSSAIEVRGIYLPSEDSLATAGGGSGPFASGGLPYLVKQRGTHNFVVRLPIGSPGKEVEIRGYLTGFSISELSEENVIEYTFGIMPQQAFTLP